MSDPIFIKQLKGIEQLIARFCDDGDGKLEEKNSEGVNEISLFNTELEAYRSGKQNVSIFENKEVAPRDATYIASPDIADVFVMKKASDKEVDLQEITLKMSKKWCKVFKDSPLSQKFFEKLCDVIKILNVKVPEKDWNKKVYSSPEEQAIDEIIAVFAGESRLNPRTIGKVRGRNSFYGLFQISQQGLTTAKHWAKEHPEIPGMKNIKQNMTLSAFRNLKGEEQLDYLVAYIGASRDASKISQDEELSPAKLWSMIKLPNLDENNPAKKARRERTIAQKQDSIDNIFKSNKVPLGIV